MSEENADSVEVETPETAEAETTETQGELDIESAVDQMGADLFGKEIPEETPEETDETTDESKDSQDDTESDETEPEQNEEKLERPDSWKKDMQETWDAMTREAQDYVIHREEQMKAGLEIDRTDSNLGRAIRDVMTPYSRLLEKNNIDEATAVRQLVNNHMQLATAPEDQKKALFEQWAKGYGVNFGENTENNEEINALRAELSQIKSYISNNQQVEMERIQGEVVKTVNDFAETHPHFDELADDIAKFVNAGYELEDAYEKAFKTSSFHESDLRQKIADEIAEEAKKKAEKVKQANSVNVRSRDTGKAHTEPTGTMEDTLRDTLKVIKSRR